MSYKRVAGVGPVGSTLGAHTTFYSVCSDLLYKTKATPRVSEHLELEGPRSEASEWSSQWGYRGDPGGSMVAPPGPGKDGKEIMVKNKKV